MCKKGSTKLYWKTDLREPEYQCGEFAKKKYRQSIMSGSPRVNRNLQYRGVQKEKVESIIETIGPLIPNDKLKFWYDVHVRDDSPDLSVNI